MHVIATAGHVDHGKSTLVRLLTGMEPDRLAEERRRGLTIEVGFAWTTLPRVGEVAFVDVPGHERFVPNMLAGVGSVPAVLFVVAADAPWMPQAEEHLAVLDALGVRHGLLVITRADLADPEPARRTARARIATTSLGDLPSVVANDNLPGLRTAIADLLLGLPEPDMRADVRLWVDRSFTVAGAGTVVTGTLQAGTLRVGDELVLRGRSVRVRALQALGTPRTEVRAVARVAVNLRGVERDSVGRGDALTTPDAFWPARVVDIAATGLPRQAVLHIGSAAAPVRVHPLRTDVSRLVLATELPLRVGDRVLVRNPGSHEVVGAAVVDLDRLAREPFYRTAHRKALGRADEPVIADWHTDPATWRSLVTRTAEELTAWREENPLETAIPTRTLARELRLPDPALVAPLVAAADGPAERGLPAPLEEALAALAVDLRVNPFRAPDAARLRALGLDGRGIAAAARAARVLKLGDNVVLLPSAVAEAAAVLSRINQPFTTGQARQALDTSRRVALPLLDLMDRSGLTERLPDDRRRLR
ncbi:selenocysteine-specific translation elongation factor [Actinokineospora sp. NBRC 105648]|uniref:selenocysteine-specific translation elongation factor n=1 Tax=Actinokineospora sp. NBRC 105648 TaxID=3032206 RepID=UPI0024A347A9|nr:selenocysteine-specific translation elongation factor [Actinokineospora sp. NBRC 105648]GLZ42855.1 selenocysteine-specific translation elongation factor [Actinokineospora sp. NBRC 105648]